MADLMAYLKLNKNRNFGTTRSEGNHGKALARPTRFVAAQEILPYAGWVGEKPLLLCRANSGEGKVAWEASVPSTGDLIRYQFPVAFGFRSQPKGTFQFSINGAKVIDLDVPAGDQVWEGPSGVRLSYFVVEENLEDNNGILNVEIPRQLVQTNQAIQFAVQGSAAGSLRWFGVYSPDPAVALPNAKPLQERTVEEVASALLAHTPESEKEKLIAENANKAAELIELLSRDLAGNKKEEYRRIPTIWRVAINTGRRNDAMEVKGVLQASLPKYGEPLRDWQAVVIGGGIINGLSEKKLWPGERITEILRHDAGLLGQWRAALEKSVSMAADSQVPSGTRYDALRMIALLSWDVVQPILVTHLAKTAHPELQQGSVSGLVDVNHPEAAELVLESFNNLTKGNQELALAGMLRTQERKNKLKQALANNVIPASAVPEKLKTELQAATQY
jgi:hypothetical protein